MRLHLRAAQLRGMAVTAAVLALAFTLTSCSNEDKENQEAYRKIGINSMAEGDYEKALDSFQKALDLSNGKIGAMEKDICYYKAAAQFASGDTDGAIKTYDALIDFDKEDAKAYYLRGSVYLGQDEADKAFKDYDAAIKADPQDYELYESIYENLVNHEYEAEAEEYLQKALGYKPKETDAYAHLGHIYYLLGDYEQAQANLDKAIDGGSMDALLTLAQVYQEQEKTEQAQAILENYVKQNQKDSEALGTLGMMQMNEGNYEQAVQYFQLGEEVEDAPNRQELMKNEIIAYESMRDFASAKQKMAVYAKEFPNDAEAAREEIFLKTR